jgi:MFS family permease
MSALLTAGQWEKVFPQTVESTAHPNHATLQSFVVAVYVSYSASIQVLRTLRLIQEVGCLLGALSNLWIGDRLGRRKTIFLGGVIMIIGAILQTTSFGYAQMVVARIITGFGNGLNVGLAYMWFALRVLNHPLRPQPCLHITQSALRLQSAAATS